MSPGSGVWWPHPDNGVVYNLSDMEVKRLISKNPLAALKVTLRCGDFINVGLFDDYLIQLFLHSLVQA